MKSKRFQCIDFNSIESYFYFWMHRHNSTQIYYNIRAHAFDKNDHVQKMKTNDERVCKIKTTVPTSTRWLNTETQTITRAKITYTSTPQLNTTNSTIFLPDKQLDFAYCTGKIQNDYEQSESRNSLLLFFIFIRINESNINLHLGRERNKSCRNAEKSG